MKLVLIAAVAQDGAIGKNNDLLWRSREDLQHFRQLTMGCTVIMGRKTWDSLPAAFKPLPGRRNIVVTANEQWRAEGAARAASVEDALLLAGQLAPEDDRLVYVIGGGELYRQTLPQADRLELTELDTEFEGADTFFPTWDRSAFTEQQRETRRAPEGFAFHWVRYARQSG